MKTIARLNLLVLFLMVLSACGGNLEDLAQQILYPFDSVNRDFPVPEVAPDGYMTLNFPVRSTDGAIMNVNAWAFSSPHPTQPKVYVYFHGNGENLQALYQVNFLKKMKEFGSHFLVIDYPGLGRSTGAANEANLVNSALVAIDWARVKWPEARIIVWGRSLGAAVAVQAAAQRQSEIAGLILTSPWNNLLSMAQATSSLASQIPQSWLDKNTYNSVLAAQRIQRPTLIHHGLKDTVIPIKLGRMVFESFPQRQIVAMLEIPGLGHNDIFTSQAVWDEISMFLR